jgi:hypothetical protein
MAFASRASGAGSLLCWGMLGVAGVYFSLAARRNPYGRPSPELLERLEVSGARMLRTDRDGAVRTLTDGDRLAISCFMVCADVSNVTTSRPAEVPN